MVTVTAKVTNCTNEGTCMTVSNNDWYLGGLYCPLGRDVAKGGIVYLRQHATPEDMRYLRLAQALGIYELRSSKRDCIEAGSVQQALRQCSTKELAFIEMKESLRSARA
ncbi:unnamed protein product [Symbiodinium sp. CCMP2456]|nr:unnamed protein product [Symbiodinium sp. CCMP2456]